MNATNRVANRIVLLIGALLSGCAGLLAIATGAHLPWADTVLSWMGRTVGDLVGTWRLRMPGGVDVPGPAVAGVALAVVVAGAAIVFLATRGGGRAAEVLREQSGHGATIVDRSVADAVVSGVLAARADVLSARTAVYRVARTPALAVTVTVRKGARLDAVLAEAESSVREWDALLGRRSPVLVHLADGRWRDSLRSRTRVR